ncbi:hypothetical protein MKW98_012445 [Papaver atlanticum]|uniref:Protein FAR1-RELATED SEQUENCE n=1 Tax=Papaver atlanticum TaxID=357466 RepID=A0AAD4RZC9_9MAGN|nr:hypothetical protein MKW98_012445 [Papaver atlanticum]
MITSKAQTGINCWIRKQQCPCGERKCYIRFEDGKNEEASSSSEPSEIIYVDVAPPFIGQTFETDDEAFEYYTNFARKSGFAIRRESSRSNQDRGVYSRVFVCHRYGPERHRKSAKAERKRDRKTTVCGCESKMYILKKIIGGVPRWSVKQFVNEHNHELLEDDQVRLLPAYRKIPDADRERILLLHKAGCSVRHIMKVLQVEKGEEEQLPFIERDVRNFVQSCKKVDRENDVSELLNVCKTVKERDADFVYDFTMDENGNLANIAWAYGDSVCAYRAFGDVVVFDATYREITYDRLLGVWFGIDNHGKTIFFGYVLLRDESYHSFSWALQAFLQFMHGRCPQTILTDIDLGLGDAIKSVLPSSKQVFCIWHIVSKLSSWFSFQLGPHYEDFKAEFDRLYNLESKKDFEGQWILMVNRFGLGSNKHIALLFSHRASWALPYLRGHFIAQMTTAEYSKSIDAFLKGILSAQTCLESFFEQVGIVSNFRTQAGEQEMEDMHIKTSMPIEEHASSILTPYAFNLLQNEIVLSMQCAAFETVNGSYLVRHHKRMDGGCLVSWMPKDEKICCSCKQFEVSGILCRHILRVLALKNYFHLPEKYLPIRWRRESSLLQSNTDGWSQAFHSLTSALYAESSLSKERVDYVHKELVRVLNDVRNMSACDGVVLNLESNPPIDVRIDAAANGSECNSTWN